MRRHDGKLLLSSGDLITFLGCRHASSLDYWALDHEVKLASDSPMLTLLKERGVAHELSYLSALECGGARVVRIPDSGSLTDRVGMTVEAMRGGAEVIYQAALIDGSWHGFADFLMRTRTPSRFGPWSYEVADTKLSSSVKPRHAVQLSLYSELLGSVQHLYPTSMTVLLGDSRSVSLPTNSFVHYVRLSAKRLQRFLADPGARAQTEAQPCSHCEICHWREHCSAEWHSADHLVQVANIRRSQREKLTAAGIVTVAALASAPGSVSIPGVNRETMSRLRAQARIQVEGRDRNKHLYDLLPTVPGKGFARLPHPAEGDLFFDMEGDPLVPGGLEYLFGVHIGEPEAGEYRGWWAHDHDAEREALRSFLEFADDHVRRYPRAHIFHYASYEVSALRRLSMRHGTCEAVLDMLLRRQKFIDLYRVVREAILISEPRYSLKNVEKLYLGPRAGGVETAADSVVAYEAWRATGEEQILLDIEQYNRFDCRSTAGLRDWLLSIRAADVPWFRSVDSGAEVLVQRRADPSSQTETDRAVVCKAPEAERPFRQIVLDLLEFHRREQKPYWWAMFDRQGHDEQELLDDVECLAGLRLSGTPVPDKRSLVHVYRCPKQETKLRVGDQPLSVDTLQPVGTIADLDVDRGVVRLRRGIDRPSLPPALNLGPEKPHDDTVLRVAVRRFAASVLAGDHRFLAVEGILRRDLPRLEGRRQGKSPILGTTDLYHGALHAVSRLKSSHLFIQGPPGTGKTWITGRLIVDMIKAGKRVGVSSNSHKAINNVLRAVEAAAKEARYQFVGFKKSRAGDPDTVFGGTMIQDVFDSGRLPRAAPLIAGTAWLFARPEYEGVVDYLFVDEAGQVSLANLVAMGTAAKNIVLVGDQMQLGQPVQGQHPGESGSSCLEYLLMGSATVPPDRGIFLDESWRMHPSVCGWVSGAIYEGRLRSHPTAAMQRLLLGSSTRPYLAPVGLRFIPVQHEGRSQHSVEEAAAVAEIWNSLIQEQWRDQHGCIRAITPADVLVLTPYNLQAAELRRSLPAEARVGTIDKFQGQEGAIAIISLATSSGEDMPRNIEFLFSKNRLNVAVSRARCLALIVGSPRLLEVQCGKLEDLARVDLLCHAYEHSERLHALTVAASSE